MITVRQLTNQFQTELNAIIRSKLSETTFKIWANVGRHQKRVRTGNIIPNVIEGWLATTASTIEANTISMGVNALKLQFVVPLEPPRTSAAQTAEELEAVQSGQYFMPETVIGVLSDYFQTPRVLSLTDKSGVDFAVGIVGGVAVPNDVKELSGYGKSLTVDVFLNANIVQNGIVSTNITVMLNGVVVPAQSKAFSRSAALNSDVVANNLSSLSLATSSAFVLQLTFPENTLTQDINEQVHHMLIGGIINEPFFTVINWNNQLYYKLMTLSKVDTAAEGVSIAGTTIQLVEVLPRIETLYIPTGYKVGRFTVYDSDIRFLWFGFRLNNVADYNFFYIGGEVVVRRASEITNKAGRIYVDITPDDFVDNGNGTYEILMIAPIECVITDSDYPYRWIF